MTLNRIISGLDKIAELLIQEGANVNVLSVSYGGTPLIYAITKSKNEFFHTLFDFIAIQSYQSFVELDKMAELIIQKGGNVNAAGKNGILPLMVAADKGENTFLIQFSRIAHHIISLHLPIYSQDFINSLKF